MDFRTKPIVRSDIFRTGRMSGGHGILNSLQEKGAEKRVGFLLCGSGRFPRRPSEREENMKMENEKVRKQDYYIILSHNCLIIKKI